MKTKEELFNDNIKLAYKLASKYLKNNVEYEEVKQMALIGLWKAAQIFDESKEYKFATLAGTVIQNEINGFLRKKTIPCVPFDYKITESLTLEDTLKDKKDVIGELIDKINLNKVCDELKEILTEKEMKVLECLFQEKKQKEIALELNVTQGYVSRVKFKIVNKFRYLNNL